MTTLYKLTDQDGYTRKDHYNECLWGPGVSHSGTGEGELCGPGFVHAYLSPELAILLNPIHANIINPRIWKCEGEIIKNDKNLKVGCITLTTFKEIEFPAFSIEQKIYFAIICAKQVFKNSNEYNKWANDWIIGIDRSAYAAYTARAAAYAAARAAADAAAAAARAADANLDPIALAKQAYEWIDPLKS